MTTTAAQLIKTAAPAAYQYGRSKQTVGHVIQATTTIEFPGEDCTVRVELRSSKNGAAIDTVARVYRVRDHETLNADYWFGVVTKRRPSLENVAKVNKEVLAAPEFEAWLSGVLADPHPFVLGRVC